MTTEPIGAQIDETVLTELKELKILNFIREVCEYAGAKGVVVGVSGGVDSACALRLAVNALGNENVMGIVLPSISTAEKDIRDALDLCKSLGVETRNINITGSVMNMRRMVKIDTPMNMDFRKLEGNIMARTRMTILYHYAGLKGYLVSGTSNKTETLLGYCTKWGDSAADYQPIAHIYKTDLWPFATAIGIPPAIVNKVPTAGLWRGQTDESELGMSYQLIDTVLRALEKRKFSPPYEDTEINPELAIMERIRKNRHKEILPPSLLKIEGI